MSVHRIFDLIHHQLENHSLKVALAGKVEGKWIKYSSKDFQTMSDKVSYGLLSIGMESGDRIAIISNNRPEWNFVDIGTLQVGCADVPIYPTISDHDLSFILEDADVRLIFVSGKELFEKAKKASGNCKKLKGIYTFDEVDGAENWESLLKKGELFQKKELLIERKDKVQHHSLATILYTSGTTGTPKGVMLSHNNLVSNFIAVRELPPTKPGDLALSFLPLNHIYERMLTYMYMYIYVSIYYAESIDTIGDNLKEIKPQVFSAVPRLLEKVYDKIVAKGSELTGFKRGLFFWALKLGEKYDPNKSGGFIYNFSLGIARKLVFSKWKDALGGNVKAIVSGGAALNPRLARIYWAAGIRVLEGYGCTETSPVIAVNNLEPNGMKIGTVGTVIQGVSVKIADDGEILCKGPNVMMGYFNRPDLTSEVIDENGWYHTGDIGILEEGRYLKITDRKKEIFKTSGGKYIAPQMIENKLKESRFIEQAIVIGENKKFASALIVPAFNFIREWAKQKSIDLEDGSNENIIAKPEVKKRIMKDIAEINKTLGHFETIKRIELIPREFTIDRGEITPKLSLKRKIIQETFKEKIDKIYGEEN